VALSEVDRRLVAKVDGAHGMELVFQGMDRDSGPAPHECPLPEVDHITVIVEPHEGFGGLVVSTWHPGDPLGSLKGHEDVAVEALPGHLAVKLRW